MTTDCASPPVPCLLSVDEAAAALRVSPYTVRDLIKLKKIDVVRVGSGRGVIRFTPAAIEQYITSRTTEATDAVMATA